MGDIQNIKRSASIVAATQVRLASLDGPVFVQTFGGAKEVGLRILRLICDRLATTNNSLGAAPPKEHAIPA
jgi:CRP-like cAMP-binding protein